MSPDFESLGLSYNIIRGVKLSGFTHPYSFHQRSIPLILSGRDVVAVAPPSSARTMSFLAPLLDSLNRRRHQQGVNSIRALILTPTENSALEILKLVRLLAQFTGLRIGVLAGDDTMGSRFEELTLQNPDVMIATPGCLTSHLSHVKDMSIHNVECIVFDEADCLLSLGFSKHLRQILFHINQNHQTLVFTDAIPSEFVKSVTRCPHIVHRVSSISSNLKLIFFTLSGDKKNAALLYLIRERIRCDESTLIFVPTRYHAEFLNLLLGEQGIDSSFCYGDMSGTARRAQVLRFRRRENKLLITTDLASRGIDLPFVDNVISWDFPCNLDRFRSRLRVTARSGQPGTAISFVTPEDIPYVLHFRIFISEEMMAAPTEEQIMQDGDTLEVVSEIDQADASNGEILYGRLPPIAVDVYADEVRKILDNSPKLKLLEEKAT